MVIEGLEREVQRCAGFDTLEVADRRLRVFEAGSPYRRMVRAKEHRPPSSLVRGGGHKSGVGMWGSRIEVVNPTTAVKEGEQQRVCMET